MLYAVLALVCAVAAILVFKMASSSLLIGLAILFAILTIVFGGLFLSSRVNKNEDIHITE